MSKKMQLAKKRADTGKDLSQRNFRQAMTTLRMALIWKKGHLVGSAMQIYFRLESAALRLLEWRKAYKPPVVDLLLLAHVGNDDPNQDDEPKKPEYATTITATSSKNFG